MNDSADRKILDDLIEGCQIISRDWRYLYVNEAAAAQGRSTKQQLLGRTMMEVYPGIEKTPLADDIRRCLTSGVCLRRENEFVHPDGSTEWFELRLQPVPEGIFILSLNITPLKRAAEEQRASDQRYRQIVESTNEAVITVDPTGKLTYANPRFGQLLGYTPEEVVGRDSFDFLDPSERTEARARPNVRLQGVSDRYERRFRHKDGQEVWMLVVSNPLMGPDGKAVGAIALMSDVTQRRVAEASMRRLAAIVESTTDAIIGRDVDGRITAWNIGAQNLFGYTVEDVLGKDIQVLIPQQLQVEEVEVTACIFGGQPVAPYETKRVRKDGSMIEVEVSVSPIRDAEGGIVGVSKIVRDLTQQRQAEAALRNTEAQLRQAQKMEAIGSLAGGVAHDFNNLLSVIMSYTGMALDDLKPGQPLHADLAEVYAAAERAGALTGQLLAFSRQQVIQPEVLDPNHVVRGVHRMLSRLLSENIQLDFLERRGTGSIYVDPGQMEQVLMNLVVNARDAMEDGGAITIETADVRLDEAYAQTHLDVKPGDYVMIAVSDTGKGMDSATQARIFEPFFTTKEKGKGTGLGLSTVYGIVKQSQGHIWMYSEPGHGTTFKVYFPRATEKPSARPAPVAAPISTHGSETLLLVEDEEPVRVAIRTILRREGYNVLEAQNGGEALLICEQYTATIHLMVTDVIMPRMSGRQLAERLSVHRPEIKVLFVSGYTENSIVHHGVLEAGINYLAKPIVPAALAKKVREVLDLPLRREAQTQKR